MRPIAASAQIAVSCPAEIFRAHGQASMIHYWALGRTVLANTRGPGGALRVVNRTIGDTITDGPRTGQAAAR